MRSAQTLLCVGIHEVRLRKGAALRASSGNLLKNKLE
jgi:hypothetical protein